MDYQFHLCRESLERAAEYLAALQQGQRQPGQRLAEALETHPLKDMEVEAFLDCLVNTKPPLIFAESAVCGDGRDWNLTELGILGDIGVSTEVTLFDNGRHSSPEIHEPPIKGTLLFVPGALLRNGQHCEPADLSEVVTNGKINPTGLARLYERRLVPLLHHANAKASEAKRPALITLPGLGCGQFAGPFQGQMGNHLKTGLIEVLTRHASRFPSIRLIYFDPYGECANETHQFDYLEFRIRPLLQNQSRNPQLCPPRQYEEAGDDFSDCILFSFVAWDHVSWPGNDFYGGSRCTDDGVKAAATNTMQMMTGIPGRYDPVSHQYTPPSPYGNWAELVQHRQLRLQVVGNLKVLGP